MSSPAGELWHVETHVDRVLEATADRRGLPVPVATPDGRYPLVYPRDVNIVTKAVDRLHRLDEVGDRRARRLLHGSAHLLLQAQGRDGRWGQRYHADGTDASIYRQEDGTAHAVATLARHLRLERRLGEASPLEEEVLDAVTRGLDAAWDHDVDGDVGLVRSTTAVHESGLERGYTLWTNAAFVQALDLARHVLHEGGREGEAAVQRTRRRELLGSVMTSLVRGDRFVRKLHADGTVDLRPDVTLLSPWLFGFRDAAPEAEAAGVAFLEEELVADRFGLLYRYPPGRVDRNVHMHGGHGPYLSFSAWWAARRADVGRPGDGSRVLHRLAEVATEAGGLPEHVAPRDRFRSFVEEELLPGRDARKELDPSILSSGASLSDLLQEVGRMVTAYGTAHEHGERLGDGVARLAAPHAWTHSWFAVALAGLHGEGRDPEALAVEA